MVSEDEDYDQEQANRSNAKDRAVENQRRLWAAEPSQRDDVLPLFVWSIVHDQNRKKADLNAFLDVSDMRRGAPKTALTLAVLRYG